MSTEEQMKAMQTAKRVMTITLLLTPLQVFLSMQIFEDSAINHLAVWFIFSSSFILYRVVKGWNRGLGFITHMAPWYLMVQVIITAALILTLVLVECFAMTVVV